MISGSDQIVKSIFSHESRATWYEPRFCIWLRVILPSRTRCWTPPFVTNIYLEIEPQRCSMSTETPSTKRSWHCPTLEWLSSLYQLQWGSWENTSCHWQGWGYPSKQCHLSVSWLSLSRGIVTSTIPNWIQQGCRPALLCRKTDISFHFHVIPVEMLVWFNMRIRYCNVPLLFYAQSPMAEDVTIGNIKLKQIRKSKHK